MQTHAETRTLLLQPKHNNFIPDVPASPEFDSRQGTRDGHKLDILAPVPVCMLRKGLKIGFYIGQRLS
jgi:hypothetical protein